LAFGRWSLAGKTQSAAPGLASSQQPIVLTLTLRSLDTLEGCPVRSVRGKEPQAIGSQTLNITLLLESVQRRRPVQLGPPYEKGAKYDFKAEQNNTSPVASVRKKEVYQIWHYGHVARDFTFRLLQSCECADARRSVLRFSILFSPISL
jgi:hypothetical protein